MKTSRAALVLGAAAVAGGVATYRRWSKGEGEPLTLPDGDDRVVRSPDGAELQVRIAGPADAAQTFVLAHCWTGDRRVWGPVAQRLTDRGHRVVLWDHRGHAGSTVGADGYTLEALGDDLRAVLEDLDLADVVLVGHSMGGMAVQAFLVRHPDARTRVAGLALVATGCAGLNPRWFRPGQRLLIRALTDPVVERVIAAERLGLALVRVSAGRRPARPHLQAARETFLATPRPARGQFMSAMLEMDFADTLGDVDIPAVVVVGRRDLMTPPPRARHLARALGNARVEIIPGAGHMLPLEAPDRVADLVQSVAPGHPAGRATLPLYS